MLANKLLNFIKITVSMSVPVLGYSIELDQGDHRNSIDISILKTIYSQYGTLPGYLYEYDDEKYYSLSKAGTAIGNYDLTSSQSTLSGWPLERWEHQHVSSYIKSSFSDFGMAYPDGSYKLDRSPSGLGCLVQFPLRYGDIEDDGVKELVLFLNDDIVFFSLEHEHIVFAETFNASNWVDEEFTQDAYERIGTESGGVQYLSELAAYNEIPDFYGIRGYSKLYLGDFDADGHSDIVVWRKTFYSRDSTDPVAGFELKDEHWQHLERDLVAQAESDQGVTGEYLPQDTEAQAIQSWLVENELTWSKGYPSISECEGQEGELILEMHDPLLNDPDVLQ